MPNFRTIAAGLLLTVLVGGVFVAPVTGAPPTTSSKPRGGAASGGNGKPAKPSATPTVKPADKPKTGAPKPKKKTKRRASRATSKPTSAPAEIAATQPSGPETAAQMLRRLNSVRVSLLKDDQIALRAALDFALAVGEASGEHAARLVDATGYQPLPGDGESQPAPTADGAIPEPPRQRSVAEVAAFVGGLSQADVSGAPSEAFELTPRIRLNARMPGAAAWMLPTDHAVVVQPASFGGAWPKRAACVIVRVRGTRASIVGGNLLEALR